MEIIRDAGSLILNFYYLALVILMVLYRKYLGKHIGIIIIAMIITFLTESVGSAVKFTEGTMNTLPLFVVSILGIVYFLFLFYFYRMMQNHQLKKFQMLLMLLHVLNFGSSLIFKKDFFSSFPEYTNFTSIFLILISLFIFLHDTFNSNKVLYIKGYFPFFVAVSLTFIYVGLVPILFFSNRIVTEVEMFTFYMMLFIINFFGYSIMLAGIFFARFQKKT